MSAIDEVKQRTDIVEVISQYASLKKAGRNFTTLCPFHSERNPSFFVYPEQQSWHCFGACNTGGDVFSFVMKKESLSFGEALRLLALRAGVSLPSRMEREGGKEEKEELQSKLEGEMQPLVQREKELKHHLSIEKGEAEEELKAADRKIAKLKQKQSDKLEEYQSMQKVWQEKLSKAEEDLQKSIRVALKSSLFP